MEHTLTFSTFELSVIYAALKLSRKHTVKANHAGIDAVLEKIRPENLFKPEPFSMSEEEKRRDEREYGE
jgi:hypothetical protein